MRIEELTPYEQEHARAYANHSLRKYLFDKYSARYPSLFANVIFETRPADTDKDFFVPKDLKDRCVVVDRLEFDETGCRTVSCFPFKEDLTGCLVNDLPRRIPIGNFLIDACQDACRHSKEFTTEYRDGRCRLLNPLKVLFAMLPETILGMKTLHYHRGLDIVDGRLRINNEYCRSYGINFDEENRDCYVTGLASFFEIILGRTIIRSINTGRYPREEVEITRSQALLMSVDGGGIVDVGGGKRRFEDDAVVGGKRMRLDDFDGKIPVSDEILIEMGQDLAVVYGVDVGLEALSKTLRKHFPRVITRLADSVVLRKSVSMLIFKSQVESVVATTRLLGMGVKGLSFATTVVGIISMFLDIFDPFEFNSVLTRRQIDKFDLDYDVYYFGNRDDYDMQMTPEQLMAVLDIDHSDEAEYLETKILEYGEALDSNIPPGRNINHLYRTVPKERSRISDAIQTAWIVFMLLCSVILIRYSIYFCLAIVIFLILKSVYSDRI
ncbi:p74 [Lasius niger]|uniref:p74 n=1 Tax=Lasius niger TaxID=67767 RepID=A0A0J7K045_LASNI|nr:p74 [Lasius niger]